MAPLLLPATAVGASPRRLGDLLRPVTFPPPPPPALLTLSPSPRTPHPLVPAPAPAPAAAATTTPPLVFPEGGG